MYLNEADFGEAYADLFCINAEVQAIVDRHREPRDVTDPAYWNGVKQKAIADWRAGLVPIWRRTAKGKQLFLGYENNPEHCLMRDEYDAARQDVSSTRNEVAAC